LGAYATCESIIGGGKLSREEKWDGKPVFSEDSNSLSLSDDIPKSCLQCGPEWQNRNGVSDFLSPKKDGWEGTGCQGPRIDMRAGLAETNLHFGDAPLRFCTGSFSLTPEAFGFC
jgi:hypothetical protein